jgi:hypothetical protein
MPRLGAWMVFEHAEQSWAVSDACCPVPHVIYQFDEIFLALDYISTELDIKFTRC